MTTSYFSQADGFLLCYSVTCRCSFNHVRAHWWDEVQKNAPAGARVVLVGTKCDVSDDDREVTYEEGCALADKLRAPFFEISAKENTDLQAAFECLAGRIRDQWQSEAG